MPFRPTVFAASLAALGPGAAQAYTLHVLHINDFHSRIEFDQRVRVRRARRRTRPLANASGARPGS